MTNFEFWANQIADMPQRDALGWCDLETGLRYNPSVNYSGKAQRVTASIRTLDARGVAKQFGGKALTGSTKQKEWAEKLRAIVLLAVSSDQAELICTCASVTGASKFWIDTRNVSPTKISALLENIIAAVKIANTMQRAGEIVDPAFIAKIKRAQAGEMGAL